MGFERSHDGSQNNLQYIIWLIKRIITQTHENRKQLANLLAIHVYNIHCHVYRNVEKFGHPSIL